MWWVGYEDVVLFQQRPIEIKMNDVGELHSATGPSIVYADGARLYLWRNEPVPYTWYTPGLTAAEALRIQNAELRRCACEFIGYDKILKVLNARIIDQDIDPEIGTLYEVDFPLDANQQATKLERFLAVVEGHSGREFAIPVPNEIDSAIGAQMWLIDLDKVDFAPIVRQ